MACKAPKCRLRKNDCYSAVVFRPSGSFGGGRELASRRRRVLLLRCAAPRLSRVVGSNSIPSNLGIPGRVVLTHAPTPSTPTTIHGNPRTRP